MTISEFVSRGVDSHSVPRMGQWSSVVTVLLAGSPYFSAICCSALSAWAGLPRSSETAFSMS